MPLRDRSLSRNPRPPRPRWDDPVDTLRGIGPKTASRLAELGVTRVVDLLLHLPRRYLDRGAVVSVAEASAADHPVLVRGRVTVTAARYVRRRMHITDGGIRDQTGWLAARWFNQPWLAERIGDGIDAVVFGRPAEARSGGRRLVNPEIEPDSGGPPDDELRPVYPPLGTLTGRRLRSAIDAALDCVDQVPDPLPEPVLRQIGAPPLGPALTGLHRPTPPTDPDERARLVEALEARAAPGHRRLAFDELVAVSAVVERSRRRRRRGSARPIAPVADLGRRSRQLLGFELTAAQWRVLREIEQDLGGSTPMARLLQGDVGSGKTAVAVMSILAAVEDGRQAALMAPTELLAEQLHRVVAGAIEATGIEPRLLTGSLQPAESRAILKGLQAGAVELVVGTHALIQERVDFADLGLVVIDEQHRFGVAQRQRLLDKGTAPHLLVMTATPIPRSLALTLYGDLDLSIIDELPPGRTPVRTVTRTSAARPKILRFLASEVADGGQAYVVYPMIEGSESIDAAALHAHLDEVRAALPAASIGVVHGRMKRSERETVAGAFRRREIQVLLATTVIEVGVDVPSASVMVIESAERFGLSQLHQLRGRVGRGSRRSWCILIAGDEVGAAAMRRLRVLETTSDGFEIAEADLEHRGPGEITGLRQWGAESFRFADLVRDRRLVADARDTARRLDESGELDEVRRALLALHPVGEQFAVG